MTRPARGDGPAGIRTKIVATVGPATRERAMLARLVDAGVDAFRLNFSHGTHEEHAAAIELIRDVTRQAGRHVAVIQDLAGPKIRLGAIPGEAVACPIGEIFTLAPERTSDDPRQLTCTHSALPGDLRPGEVVLFADGAVAMKVLSADAREAVLEVVLPGRLRSRQGMNLPGTGLSVDSLTAKDRADLDWAAVHEVDFVALSFVRRAEDLRVLRRELAERGVAAQVMAKIEKPEAVAAIDGILDECDAIMIARGDLGVEMDVALVPGIQKRILAACRRAGVPAITATQVLASMESSPRPTRAEASDAFNAVLDGTDAVMLSGETAIGAFPVEAVTTMGRIAAEAERLLPAAGDGGGGAASGRGAVSPVTSAIVEAAGLACRRLDAALLLVVTQSGRTALAASNLRLQAPIVALTPDEAVARRISLAWGVTPVHVPEATDLADALELGVAWAKARGLVAPGDRIACVQGTMPGSRIHDGLVVRVAG